MWMSEKCSSFMRGLYHGKMWAVFKDRISKIKNLLINKKIDAVLVSSVSNITYLTGYENFSPKEREAYIFIGENFQYIITDGRYAEAIKREVPHLKLFERGHENPKEKLLKELKDKIQVLGIEEDNLTVAEHQILVKHFKNLKHFSLSRAVKEKQDLEKIEKAAKLGDLAFDYILKNIKEGITEE